EHEPPRVVRAAQSVDRRRRPQAAPPLERDRPERTASRALGEAARRRAGLGPVLGGNRRAFLLPGFIEGRASAGIQSAGLAGNASSDDQRADVENAGRCPAGHQGKVNRAAWAGLIRRWFRPPERLRKEADPMAPSDRRL